MFLINIFAHIILSSATECSKLSDSRKKKLIHGSDTFKFLFTKVTDQFITPNKLKKQSKNHQHWSMTFRRKVHRLFSKDVCGKHYVLKMYCFIFVRGVGGRRQLAVGEHPLDVSSEWCVLVRALGCKFHAVRPSDGKMKTSLAHLQ